MLGTTLEQNTVQEKRSAILHATLELVAENGFHAAPVSKIAKRSNVSAGIIYHYFDNKDEVMRCLYAEIKRDLAKALMQGKPHQLPWPEHMKRIWLNAYHYYSSHPLETRFLEQFENSPYYPGAEPLYDESDYRDLVQVLQADLERGTVKALPFEAFYDLTLGVALSLAKRTIAGSLTLDDATLDTIADAICEAVGQELS
jgi:AcrR family transcriptional regulator